MASINTSCPFQRVSRHQADTYRPVGSGRQTRRGVESSPRRSRRKPPKSTAFKIATTETSAPEPLSHPRRPTANRHDLQPGSNRTAKQLAHQETPAQIIMQVPDDGNPRRSRPRAEQMGLHAIGLNDVRAFVMDELPQASQVRDGFKRNSGSPEERTRRPSVPRCPNLRSITTEVEAGALHKRCQELPRPLARDRRRKARPGRTPGERVARTSRRHISRRRGRPWG